MKTNLFLSTALLAIGYSVYASQNNINAEKEISSGNTIADITGGLLYDSVTYYTKDSSYFGKDSLSGVCYNFRNNTRLSKPSQNVMGGIPEPGVTVTIYGIKGEKVASTTTNSLGEYRINNLAAGKYKIIASKNNKTQELPPVVLDGNPSTPTPVYIDMSNAITSLMNEGVNVSDEISLYPTLVRSVLTIDLGSFISNEQSVDVTLYSNSGNAVFNSKYSTNSLIEIPTQGLESGSYVAKIISGKMVGAKKFIKVD